MTHDKAIIINKFWAGIIATIVTSFIIGGVGYAWNANAQISMLQSDVNDLKAAKLDVRLARMEEKLDWLVQSQRGARR